MSMVKLYDKQVYDPNMACHHHADECDADVTEYYFSDGSTLPLCSFHAMRAPVVGDDGTLMSKQYYDEVYRNK